MFSEAELREVKELANAYELRHVKAAMEHAYRAHDEMGQVYNEGPYSDHLRQVDVLLCEWLGALPGLPHKMRTVVRVGGILHDWFEDCILSPELHPVMAAVLVKDHPVYGVDIALLCTDPPGDTRFERKRLAYQRIRGCYGALLVKLADRVCHLRISAERDSLRFLRMYVGEHEDFSRELLSVRSARFEQLSPLYERASQDYLKAMEVARTRLAELEVASSGDESSAPTA